MAHFSWVERQERVKWAVLVLGSMYAHTLLYSSRGRRINIWVGLRLRPCVLSDSDLLSKTKERKRSAAHNESRQQDLPVPTFYSLPPIHLQLQKSPWIISPVRDYFGQTEGWPHHRTVLPVGGLGLREHRQKWAKADRVTLSMADTGRSIFGQLLPSRRRWWGWHPEHQFASPANTNICLASPPLFRPTSNNKARLLHCPHGQSKELMTHPAHQRCPIAPTCLERGTGKHSGPGWWSTSRVRN